MKWYHEFASHHTKALRWAYRRPGFNEPASKEGISW